MINKLATAAALFGLAATPLMAETMVQDTDENGAYSMEELTVAYPELTEEIFGQIDVDQSGEVSPEELTAAVDAGLVTAG